MTSTDQAAKLDTAAKCFDAVSAWACGEGSKEAASLAMWTAYGALDQGCDEETKLTLKRAVSYFHTTERQLSEG